MGIQLNDHKRLPFRSDGSTIYFTTWFPTDDEIEMYEHIVITSDQPWDPNNLVMPGGDNDNSATGDYACAIQQMMSNERHHKRYESDCVALTIDGNTEQLLYERMIQSVQTTKQRQV